MKASTDEASLSAWLETALGAPPLDIAPYARALTHASREQPDYERLEFLGDRVLGLSMAEWLFDAFPEEAEGALSKRLNALVSGAVCAEVAREIGVGAHLRLGKQARDDGAGDSDHVLGDVMEALLGALYRERGLDAARAAVRRLWATRLHADASAPQHPKSALQEWAAANNRGTPVYALVDRAGPGHAPRFTVTVRLGGNEAQGEGASKQEAETSAARTLLASVTTQKPAVRRRRPDARPRGRR